MRRILLLEDDLAIIKNLVFLLEKEGYEVETATTQNNAMERIQLNEYDLALLDITLPDGSGYNVCTALKKISQTPVIFLTALGDEFSVVTGFDLGADDYIAKPFRPMELISRIKNVMRRTGKIKSIFEILDLRVDLEKATVHKDGVEVFLSALEYRLLLVFINNVGVTLSRNRLLEEIWDVAGDFVNDNTLTVYIKRLREKIDNPDNPQIILTIRGLGYRLGE